MKLLHVLVEGLLLDTLILFPLLVAGGHLLAKKKPMDAAVSAGVMVIAWFGVLAGLWIIGQSLGGLDALAVALFRSAARGRRAALDTGLSLPGAYANGIVLVALLATAVNVAWARLSPAKYLFLNPVHVVLGAGLLLLLFYRAGASIYVAVPIIAVIVGSAMAWLPWISVTPSRVAAKSAKYELGSFHTGLLVGVAWLAGRVGGTARKSSKKDGESLLPVIISGVVVSALAFLLAINAGQATTEKALGTNVLLHIVPSAGASYYLIGALMIGFVFAAGLWILMFSAAYVIRELAAGFPGWHRLLPGVTPAVDGLFLLSESPRDAVVGFLLSLAGGMIGFYLFGWIGLTAIAPGMLVAATAGHLISGGVAGVVSSRIGGNRALLILAPAHGLVLSLLTSLAVSASRGVGPATSSPVGTELSDLSVVGLVVSWILQLFS